MTVATPETGVKPHPPLLPESLVRFADKHPLVSLCAAVLLLPLTIASATYLISKALLLRGARPLAIVVIVVGAGLTVGGAAWFAASGGGDDGRGHAPRQVDKGNNMGYYDYDLCRDAGHGRADCLWGTG